MLEVNDFNAVRISLASPEQIRSWSYGQVTKPETINYRTLKPEKDGLFCEKIFGPTKDFECYCGKYKRVRYKGIICDKCGVEVTRSKVRRERMGHIELAAPVSHIWFFKGTPSRLGLLLDMSPRSLERVLYFSQYIITRVDEEARRAAIQSLREEASRGLAHREEEAVESVEVLRARAEADIERLEARRQEEHTLIEEELAAAVDEIMTRATALESTLSQSLRQKVEEEVTLEGHTIVPAGGLVSRACIDELRKVVAERVAQIESEFAQRREGQDAAIDTQVEQLRLEIARGLEAESDSVTEDREQLDEEIKERIHQLEDLRTMNLMGEASYRELMERFPHVFRASMGAEAVLEILGNMDMEQLRAQLHQEIRSTSGQRRKKATKRLRVVEALRKSGNKPEWMVFTVLPVLPPDLRPMVQLDGGRFATSDLNDLYRRVINRNNRLRRLLELGAPEIIIRNEKRMLQEAVDSLIDNGRRGRPVSGSGNHKLKSLSDMLKGKQGRFRQNLLGKRVDYSGRSVIVVGPELKLHECGLPRRMALELFKPFVMRHLVQRGLAHNIKSAKRIVERVRPEVWDVLEDVVHGRPVLLNRAPTLHRLGIQAFMPILISGSAIQVHPLVCSAFNADFDGDQMAVHVPLSEAAVREAKGLLISTHNMLSPSSGEPTVAPTLDMVVGCFYLTGVHPGAKGTGKVFGSREEARLVYELGSLDLRAEIEVRDPSVDGGRLKTTVGRIILNSTLPPEIGFQNHQMDKKGLKEVVARCYELLGEEKTAEVVDTLKRLGFRYATQSGITIAISDITVPAAKEEIMAAADARIAEVENQFGRGLITEEERYASAVRIWMEASDAISRAVEQTLDPEGSLAMMAWSGAKGNVSQIRQMAAMRGLMSDPTGRIIDLPIRSSFRQGLTVLEYFISTHGARKGLADTAIRTADSGYLTRRLIDVAQDAIVLEDDCGTTGGVWEVDTPEGREIEPFSERIIGRRLAGPVAHPKTGEVLLERNEEIKEEHATLFHSLGINRLQVRSPLSCEARRGVCQLCYSRSLGRGRPVAIGEAVGIIAAQSIGEPGTQLTMKTFHTGGVAGVDITSGLPRVEELFEARVPKGQAVISEIDGRVEILGEGDQRRIKVVSAEIYRDEHPIPVGYTRLVEPGAEVDVGTVLARMPQPEEDEQASLVAGAEPIDLVSHVKGRVTLENGALAVYYEVKEEREYPFAGGARLLVTASQEVKAGDQLTDGAVNPQDILRIQGREAVQFYLLNEVQKVYRSQGVNINDKHIEVIIRQMLKRVRVDIPGDTELLPGELVDRFVYEDINAKVLAEGGEPATAQTVLLGVTKSALNTDSFLAAASFQETTRVLTEAALDGKTDRLMGLKENVIIGKLIPARDRSLDEPRRKVSSIQELLELEGLDEELAVLRGLGGTMIDAPIEDDVQD